jgi:hypothetical protein
MPAWSIIVFPPQLLHRRRWPAFGTVTLSGSALTLTSASRLQASQVPVTARTPFSRIFARVIGAPGLLPHGSSRKPVDR